jgi:hypothetical protein
MDYTTDQQETSPESEALKRAFCVLGRTEKMYERGVIATQQTTRRHIPEDDTLHNHRRGNLKSYIKQ